MHQKVLLFLENLKKEEEIRYPAMTRHVSRPAGKRCSPRLEVIYEREEEEEESERQRAWMDYAAAAAAEAAGM